MLSAPAAPDVGLDLSVPWGLAEKTTWAGVAAESLSRDAAMTKKDFHRAGPKPSAQSTAAQRVATRERMATSKLAAPAASAQVRRRPGAQE